MGPRLAVIEPENDAIASTDAQVMARVCWHYFKEGQTQDEIAKRLGLTRKRVNRVLNEARASGFVQITIDSAVSACVGLEARLVEKFGLRRAIVVPSPEPDVDVRTVVGAAGGAIHLRAAGGGRQPRHHLGRHHQRGRAKRAAPARSSAIRSFSCAGGSPRTRVSTLTTTRPCSRGRWMRPASTSLRRCSPRPSSFATRS